VTRELTSDLSMLERLVAPAGRDVVDIGCGAGALVRELGARGARTIGIEISEQQLVNARERDDGTGARYLVGSAQSLPLDDASVDVAVFMRTLHHVRPEDLLLALREARRVVRSDGAVYVAEPLPEGDYFTLTSVIEDELEVRAAAQAALERAAQAGLDRVRSVEYDVRVCVAGLAGFRARTVAVDPARAEVFDARSERLEELLTRLGEPGAEPGERCFRVPMRADLLTRAAP
jgi:SAM-dependent methyltransferase